MGNHTIGRCEISELQFVPDATPPKEMDLSESSIVQLKSPIRSSTRSIEHQLTSTSSLINRITEHQLTSTSSIMTESSKAFQYPSFIKKLGKQLTEQLPEETTDTPPQQQYNKRQGRSSSSSSAGSSNDYYDAQDPSMSPPPTHYNLRKSVRRSTQYSVESSGSDESDRHSVNSNKSRRQSKQSSHHSPYFNQSRQASHHSDPVVGYNANSHQGQITSPLGKFIVNTNSRPGPNNSIEEYIMEQGGNYISPNASMRNFHKLCTRATKYDRVNPEPETEEPKLQQIRSSSSTISNNDTSPEPSLMDAKKVESQHKDVSPLVSRYMGLSEPSHQTLHTGGGSQMMVAKPKPSVSHHKFNLQEVKAKFTNLFVA